MTAGAWTFVVLYFIVLPALILTWLVLDQRADNRYWKKRAEQRRLAERILEAERRAGRGVPR